MTSYFNGQPLSAESEQSLDNRAFRYGDALFESIRLSEGHLLWFHDHWKRLQQGMDFFGFQYSESFKEELLQQMQHIIQQQALGEGRIRIQVIRKNGGLYQPTNNQIDYLIQLAPLPDKAYQLNTKGLLLGLYTGLPKTNNALSQLKHCGNHHSILAGVYAQKHMLNDCLLINDRGSIAEATSSNVFIIKGNQLLTPALDMACLNGIMRRKVLLVAKNVGMSVRETFLLTEDITNADEIFLTNAIRGIQWVVGFGQQRYLSRQTRLLAQALNAYTTQHIQKFQ